jgi:type I pantothenate kinase
MDQTDIQPPALDHFTGDDFSPYRFFTAEKWAEFRADTPLTLSEDEVRGSARSTIRSISTKSGGSTCHCRGCLSAHVESSQLLFEQRKRFLNLSNVVKTPFIIGIAGSVAVGKSTTARVWPNF